MRNVICAVLVLVVAACRDAKPQPREMPHPALLGRKSEAVIAHFESTCPGRLSRTIGEFIEIHSCNLPDRVWYDMIFDRHDRIRTLEVVASPAEALRIYDRAFAPIVPAENREPLRESLTTPKRDRFAKGSDLVWRDVLVEPGEGVVRMHFVAEHMRRGEQGTISWEVLDREFVTSETLEHLVPL